VIEWDSFQPVSARDDRLEADPTLAHEKSRNE